MPFTLGPRAGCAHRSQVWGVVAALAAIGLAGCGGSDRPKTIPISGRGTIDGTPPGEFGNLFFPPPRAADGYVKRPASGSFSDQGSYRVMSWAPDDGLVPGHYLVAVTPADPATTKIPEKYHQSGTSGLEIEIPFDVKKVEFDIPVSSR